MVRPRVSVSRYFPSLGIVIHGTYDRVFQTPSSENILLSSSASVLSLNPQVLRLAVEPSHGDDFEAGLSKGILGKVRLDTTVYRRQSNNYADDDQLLSTAVSFPIAFRKAVIYGAEAETRTSGLASLLRLRQLLLHAGQRVVPGDRRPVSGRQRRGRHQPTERPLPYFAGSAEHAAGAPALSGAFARLVCGGHRIGQRLALRARRKTRSHNTDRRLRIA